MNSPAAPAHTPTMSRAAAASLGRCQPAESVAIPATAANSAPSMTALDDGAVVAGHSVGGMILINALAERPPERELRAIVLIAAPFVGAGGWPGDEFELPHDLGARLPQGVPVHVFHGLQDETAPPSHADLYARVIPQAQLHRLPGRDHQLDNDLSEVAKMIGPDDLGPVTQG
jgi:pimeloyl-ACP methyl ester carboxylesterase